MIRWCFLFTLFVSSCLFAQESVIEKISRVLSNKNTNEEVVAIHRLDVGLTNENYIAKIGSISYFVRCYLPQNSVLGTSLTNEWLVASYVSSAGIAPKILHYSSDEGIMVSEFIDAKDRKIDLRDSLKREEFCTLVRKLHSLEGEFPSEFCPYECINAYTKSAIKAGAVLPEEFLDIVTLKLDQLRFKFKDSQRKVPCHLDLYSLNVMDDGNRMYIVDWEYAAMGDPLFDLATTPSADFFNDQEMKDLLKAYLQREPSQEEWDYFYYMRILADVRWGVWSYLQSRISNIDTSFIEIGNTFFNQAMQRLKYLENKIDIPG